MTGWSTVEHNSGICQECKLLVLVEAAALNDERRPEPMPGLLAVDADKVRA